MVGLNQPLFFDRLVAKVSNVVFQVVFYLYHQYLMLIYLFQQFARRLH